MTPSEKLNSISEIQDPSEEHILSLRIKKNLLKEIETVAAKEKMSKSDYIRKAVSDAISISEVLRHNSTFLVSPQMIKLAVAKMSDEEIDQFALLSLQNGKEVLKLYLKKNIQSSIVKKYLTNKKTIIIGLLTYIIHSILAPTAQNWFSKIHASWDADKMIITGTHLLGINFSKFIQAYFKHFFDLFAYKEQINERILQEDKLKLVYQGETTEFDISIFLK
jgi:hypothetical protein